jgi:uncharacterized protein YdaT
MPWTRERFPAAMRNLEPEIRDKAIDIANALLRDGRDEGFAIRVAISRAAEWGRQHGLLSALRTDDSSR